MVIAARRSRRAERLGEQALLALREQAPGDDSSTVTSWITAASGVVVPAALSSTAVLGPTLESRNAQPGRTARDAARKANATHRGYARTDITVPDK